MTTVAPPNIISPLQLERLRAARGSWKEALSTADEKKQDWLTARQTRDDRREGLAKACDENEAKTVNDVTPAHTDEALARMAKDYSRAEHKFVEKDRAKRSVEDLAKKMEAKFIEIAERIAESKEEDMFSVKVDTGAAWRDVLIADIVGDLQATQFVKNNVRTVGDMLEDDNNVRGLMKSGDIEKKAGQFVCQSVAISVKTKGFASALPDWLSSLLDKPRLTQIEPKKESKDNLPTPQAVAGEETPGKDE